MNKKEQAYVEELLTRLALRWTAEVRPDIMPPSHNDRTGPNILNGYLFNTYSREIVPACTSSVSHGRGYHNKITSRNPVSLYSTKVLALKALRHALEKDLARQLRAIDQLIEAEETAKVGRPHAA